MLEFLTVLRRRWRVVVTMAVLGVAASSVLTMMMEPSYRAESQLFVAFASSQTDDSASSLEEGSLFTANRVTSYPELVTSPRVLQPVIDELGLDTTSAELADRVAAQVPPGTSLIEVYVDDDSAARSAAITNAVTRNLRSVVQNLDSAGGGQPAVRLTVTREAAEPESPRSPVPGINVTAGLAAGLALGVGLAMLRESLDTTVKDEQDVLELTGLATLASVPVNPDFAETPVMPVGVAAPAWAEPFRRLRTAVRYLSPDEPPRTLLVASPNAGDGKTVTAANLAASLAQGGRRTVLVDADLRRPGLATLLGLVPDVGVTTAVADKAPVAEVVQRAHGFDVITSGPVPPNPSELLESNAFRALVRGLREEYEAVVLDSPPLTTVTDGALLADVADAVILVCRSGRTRAPDLGSALRALAAVDARVAGVVLNRASDAASAPYRGDYGLRETSH